MLGREVALAVVEGVVYICSWEMRILPATFGAAKKVGMRYRQGHGHGHGHGQGLARSCKASPFV